MNANTTLASCLIAVLYLVLWSCTPPAQVGEIQGEKPFFDIEAYFEAEIASLNEKQPALKKKVTYNGAEETQVSEKNDFTTELKLFVDSDINRPAWSDKYQVDSLQKTENLSSVVYTATDSSLRIRKVRIDYELEAVSRIEIYKEQESFIGRSHQSLLYIPGQGYTINSFQKTILAQAKDLAIETSFRR